MKLQKIMDIGSGIMIDFGECINIKAYLLHIVLMQNQIINIIYNNEAISISRDASLQQLMRNRKLMKCPLSVWNDLFITKDGISSEFALREVLKAKIHNYDSSNEVNSFILKDNKYWLSKDTRVSLQHLINCSKDEVSIVLGNQIVTTSKDKASKFLSQLEVYAGQCYLQTQKHLFAVKELKTVEDLINYDYTKGYPEKITFNA